MTKHEIVTQLVRDPYVVEYQSRDREFAELIRRVTASGYEWQSSEEILMGKGEISAQELEEIYQKRLASLLQKIGESAPENEEVREIRISIENLLSFWKQFPQSHIQLVFFKCSTMTYTVFFSRWKEHIKVISIIRGGKVPDIFLPDG